jgi:hypothetical protein
MPFTVQNVRRKMAAVGDRRLRSGQYGWADARRVTGGLTAAGAERVYAEKIGGGCHRQEGQLTNRPTHGSLLRSKQTIEILT